MLRTPPGSTRVSSTPLRTVNVPPRWRAGVYVAEGEFLVWDALSSIEEKKKKTPGARASPARSSHAHATSVPPVEARKLSARLREDERFPMRCPEPGHLQPLAGLLLCLYLFILGSLVSFHPGRALVAEMNFSRGDTSPKTRSFRGCSDSCLSASSAPGCWKPAVTPR